MLYLTTKIPKYLLLHQTYQMLKFLTLSYSELLSITTHYNWMLKPNINFLIPTQLTCLILPRCFSSLNQAAKNPRSFSLWPNPKTHAAKSILCTSPFDRTQKAWRSQSYRQQYLTKSLFPDLPLWVCDLWCLWVLWVWWWVLWVWWVVMEVVGCRLWRLWVVVEVVSLSVVFDGGSSLFHWVAVGCGLWWGCLGLLQWVVVVGCSGG